MSSYEHNASTSRPEQRRRPIETGEAIAVVCLVVGLLVYHAFTIGRQSWFIDEANELVHCRVAWAEIIHVPDSMPPLYSYLLKAWTSTFGVETARWPSALCGIATVVAMWWYARQVVSQRIAVVAAGVLAISPFLLYYSQLVRAYSMFTLLACLTIGQFAITVRQPSKGKWALLGLLWVLGMFTHYYFAFVIVALWIIGLAADARRFVLPLLLTSIAAGVLSLPILISLKSDFAFQHDLREPRPLSLAAAAYTYVSFFSGYTLGPSKPELQTFPVREAAKQVMPWAVAIGGCSLLLGMAGIKRLASQRLASAVVLLAVLPIILAGGLGVATGITYNVRFVVWCIVPIAVLMASGMAESWPRWWGKLATIGLLVISLVAINNRTFVPRYQNEDLRAAAEFIEQEGEQASRVFVVSDYLSCVLDFYMAEPDRIAELPVAGEANQIIDSAADVQLAIDSMDQLTSTGEECWVVYSRAFHGDPEQLLLDRLLDDQQLELAAEFAGVRVYRHAAEQRE
ncbi:glycosyltransferase family 39 protein [Aeoliella mucimassa]|uniref:Glycosyltransferase RgtA/B/C/D-like domain-containing protein n=1 Tax=Aeoliella mucimassa TaxID=2527972 RepID=A0A518AMX4_9BACT|nr:glycosyltransferase family 39 protein [Aeoliella mucimassa]QDU56087.1 hypothetical protein Pan181_22900 [Aeoliella mucimassa]